MKKAVLATCLICGASLFPLQVLAQTATNEDVDAAKNAVDLRTYQSLADLMVQQKEAETRRAIAEAEKAELLAKIPSTDTKALAGSVNSEKFGAAGLVKAFDLAKEMAAQVCQSTGQFGTLAVYDATALQGIVSARIVDRELASMTKQLGDARGTLDAAVGQKPIGPAIAPLLAIGLATTAIKSAADLASLFKTNVTVASTGFGDGTRSLFSTALVEKCPTRITGLGVGYLGELDSTRYEALRGRFAALNQSRNDYAERVDTAKKLADAEKAGPRKIELNNLVAVANLMLKTVDAFIDSLKPSDISDKSPLYNAARYLSYAARTDGSNLLDFDLRLEGLTLTKESIFSGQRLRLSGVAFLTYRVYRPDGVMLKAEALRRITPPIEIDLRGQNPEGDFWDGPKQAIGN